MFFFSTITNQQIAQEHYVLGLDHLAAGEYELAVAELELALERAQSLLNQILEPRSPLSC
jgi:Tfp pilus assembly protein PilF